MSLINKLNYLPIAVSQEPQPEVAPQPPATPPPVNTGIASTSDAFENAAPLNPFGLITQQTTPPVNTQQPAVPDQTVDASSVFNYFNAGNEISVPRDARLQEMVENLNSLKNKRREIQTELENTKKQSLDAQQAISALDEALNSDKPIPDEIVQMLGPLGILGMIGGLPALPIIGGIAGAFGLNEEYRQRMERAKAELERKMGEMEAGNEQLESELDEVQKDSENTMILIEREKLRLEEEARPAQSLDPLSINKMIAEEPWQEFSFDQNQIQQKNPPFAIDFGSIDQKKLMNGSNE